MSDKFNELEQYLLEQMLKLDSTTRKSRGSGCGNDIGDLVCKDYFFEAKIKHSHANIIADREKELQDLRNKMPVQTQKEPVWAYENKYGEKYILLEADTFFRLLEKLKE